MINSQRKIRVLHIVDGYRLGGAEYKLYELIKELDQSKFDLFLINVGPEGKLSDRFESLPVPKINLARRNRFDLIPFYKLYLFLRKEKIDIIQTTLFWADFIGSLVGSCAKVPAKISWETVTHSGKFYHNKIQRLMGYRLAMHFCSTIVAVSQQVKNSVCTYPGISAKKVEVIRYGVDLGRFKPLDNHVKVKKRQEFKFPPNAFVIGVIGRLEPQKGHKVLIDAVSPLIKQDKNIFLLFAGDGIARKNLEAQIRNEGIHDNFRILGVRNDICEILNTIDLFCLPSLTGEGLPNAILEAMACGKPVLATDVGGSKEVVKTGINGFMVPPNNPVALLKPIKELLSDKANLESLSHSARKYVSDHFSLQKQLDQFQDLYVHLYRACKNR